MYLIKQGQVVHFHIVNQTEEFHILHLHGHFFSVVKRDGKPLQGSPLSIDSLLVAPFEEWDIAFVADNPGLWMVHYHVLVHTAFGMSAMVLFGVSVIRARVFSRWAGILLILGTVGVPIAYLTGLPEKVVIAGPLAQETRH